MRQEQTWDELQQVLRNITYVDGSSFLLHRRDDDNYALMYVLIHAPNTYGGSPGNRVDRYTRHEFVVPVTTYNYQTWRRWVYEQLKRVAIHEVSEWFQDEGVRVFAPHHGNGEDPYVEWHDRPDRAEQVLKSPGEG
jgi:hypothetical protein